MRFALKCLCFTIALVAASSVRPLQAQETKPTFTVDAAKAKTGMSVFAAKGCAACHTIGKGRTIGPDLKGVLERRELAWVQKWLANTTDMLKTDSIAKVMLKEANGIPMPQLPLTPAEIDALVHYVVQEGNKAK
ncbi:MAG: cytochrome c [Longimicrobiales bacterium]